VGSDPHWTLSRPADPAPSTATPGEAILPTAAGTLPVRRAAALASLPGFCHTPPFLRQRSRRVGPRFLAGNVHVPNTESAKKRVRQTKKRNALNNWRKRQIKDQTKSFLKSLTTGDVAAAETEFRKVAAILDKIATKKTIHRNAASRRKSRLAKRLNALKKTKA
jgi:small subunit ribosomal protein S20